MFEVYKSCPQSKLWIVFLWLVSQVLCFRLISNSILLVNLRPLKMYTSRKKILKDKDAEPTEFEETVAQVIIAVFVLEIYCLAP